MLARLQSLLILRFAAAILLATIGLQALLPAAATLEQRHGSAFSATTFEVAVAAERTATRKAFAPQPIAPLDDVQTGAVTEIAALASPSGPRPASTGPPLGDSLSWRPAPRAPPHA